MKLEEFSEMIPVVDTEEGLRIWVEVLEGSFHNCIPPFKVIKSGEESEMDLMRVFLKTHDISELPPYGQALARKCLAESESSSDKVSE